MQNTDSTSWIVFSFFFLCIPISFTAFFNICSNTSRGASTVDKSGQEEPSWGFQKNSGCWKLTAWGWFSLQDVPAFIHFSHCIFIILAQKNYNWLPPYFFRLSSVHVPQSPDYMIFTLVLCVFVASIYLKPTFLIFLNFSCMTPELLS